MPIADELPEGITIADIEGWYDRFRFYRHAPSREDILEWVRQFQSEHYQLAKKILDHVILIRDLDIHQGYRDALQAIPGWSRNDAQRQGEWAFVGLGGQAESGPAMLHMFREANNLTSDRYQSMFVSPAELPGLRLTALDTVIFVDDFAGTGDQFIKRWDQYQELIASEARTYLFLAAATARAMARFSALDDIDVRAHQVLGPDANVLSPDNAQFHGQEKETIIQYCERADPRSPRGWGECGLLLVISRKTPNNSLPILHVDVRRRWKGIFPRQLKPPRRQAGAGG
jgi:AcrR family transcriptional regulator